MGKNVIYAFAEMAILLILTYVLLQDAVTTIYQTGKVFQALNYTATVNYQTFTYPMTGYLAAIIDVLFQNDFSQMYLVIWAGSGLVLGMIRRSGGGGFALGFYASVYLMIIYYLILTINEVYILPLDTFGEFWFIVGIIYPAVANGIFCGLVGGLGGKITKPRKQKMTKGYTERLLASFPYKCPSCGAQFFSNSKFCSVCGAEMAPTEAVETSSA